MKNGNWIPLRKGYTFPKHREFSEIEAAYSLQLDYDNDNDFTVSGMAANWKWSETKVRNFLMLMGIEIKYPETTSRRKRGKLIPSERRIKEEQSENKERIKEDIKLFCFNDIDHAEKNKRRIKEEQKKNKAQATIDTDTKPNKKIYGEKVKLLAEEHEKLISQFGEKETSERITRLDEYLCSKGKKYASHYHTILTWARRDGWKPKETAQEAYNRKVQAAL